MEMSIDDIPKKEKRVPPYLSPELMANKALVSAISSSIKEIIGNIQVTVERDEDGSPKEVVGVDKVIQLLGDLKAVLGRLPQKFPDFPKLPEAPRSVEVSNLPAIPSVDLARVESLLEDVKTALMAVEPKESVKVENLGDINIPQVDYDLIASIVASVQSEPTDLTPLIKSIEQTNQAMPTGGHPSFLDPDGDVNRARIDSNKVLRTSSDGYKKLLTYTATGKTEYVGMAWAGTATSAAKWQIQKLAYDGSDRLISVLFAQGSDKFQNVWDDKASYTYN